MGYNILKTIHKKKKSKKAKWLSEEASQVAEKRREAKGKGEKERLKVKSESEVAQLCLTPSNPMDCGLPGFSVHGIFQARVLEWGAIAFSV